MVVTGLAMSPAVTAAFPFLLRLFGGYQSARTIHFFTFVALLLFVLVHVVMVVRSGFSRQMRAMHRGENDMKTSGLITRRRAIVTGLAAAGGLLLTRYPKDLPPTYGNLLRMGDTLTYAAHRALLPGQSLVREYSPDDITSFPATGTTNPGVSDKIAVGRRLPSLAGRRRSPTGGCRSRAASATPRTFSLAELKRLPSRTQITRHTCEEGWTAIGQWTGVPLSRVLDAAGILPTARFVVFHSYDDWVDSIDLLDALHPQTILAYGMNGRDLPVAARRAAAAAGGTADGLQEHEVPPAHRRDRRVRRRRREGEHPERLGVVHGNLSRRPTSDHSRQWPEKCAPRCVRFTWDWQRYEAMETIFRPLEPRD